MLSSDGESASTEDDEDDEDEEEEAEYEQRQPHRRSGESTRARSGGRGGGRGGGTRRRNEQRRQAPRAALPDHRLASDMARFLARGSARDAESSASHQRPEAVDLTSGNSPFAAAARSASLMTTTHSRSAHLLGAVGHSPLPPPRVVTVGHSPLPPPRFITWARAGRVPRRPRGVTPPPLQRLLAHTPIRPRRRHRRHPTRSRAHNPARSRALKAATSPRY